MKYMKVSDKMSDRIVIFEALGWVGACLSAMLNFAWAWFFVVGFMVLGMILNGVRSNEVVSKKLLFYPIIPWFLSYMVSMLGAIYYHLHFLDKPPTFYIMGQHPSHFFMLIFYWIGGILTISAGFAINRYEWCSEKSWEDYKKVIEKYRGTKND